MTFGNRTSYCSLKDAFGVQSFSVDTVPIHNTEQHTFSYKVEPEIEETPFIEKMSGLNHSDVEQHIDSCPECAVRMKQYGPVGTSLNEILNIILICILLFIVIYKPNF